MKEKINYLFVLFCVFAINMYSQPYNFPIRPGDEEWKQFNNSEEMYLACQIPEEMLKSMSTGDLVTTCLNYPLLSTLFAYDDLQTGFNALTKKFNGIQELISRKDSGTELIKVYSKMSPNNYNSEWTDEQKGNFTFEFSYIETFLAQKVILSTLIVAEKKDLVKLCFDKYNSKQKHISIFSTHGTSISIWVMGRSLESDTSQNLESDKANFAKSIFIEKGLLVDLAIIDDIMEKGRMFIE